MKRFLSTLVVSLAAILGFASGGDSGPIPIWQINADPIISPIINSNCVAIGGTNYSAPIVLCPDGTASFAGSIDAAEFIGAGGSGIPYSEKGAANGVATLDASQKLTYSEIPDSLLGGVSFQGTYDIPGDSPTLPSCVSTTIGYYYIVSVAGTLSQPKYEYYDVSDWVVCDATGWSKVDNVDSVTSVNGYIGDVTGLEEIANKAQTVTGSTTLYPSNTAVVNFVNSSISTHNNPQYHFDELDELVNVQLAACGNGMALVMSTDNYTWVCQYLAGAGDNLGSHVASQTLEMSSYDINNTRAVLLRWATPTVFFDDNDAGDDNWYIYPNADDLEIVQVVGDATPTVRLTIDGGTGALSGPPNVLPMICSNGQFSIWDSTGSAWACTTMEHDNTWSEHPALTDVDMNGFGFSAIGELDPLKYSPQIGMMLDTEWEFYEAGNSVGLFAYSSDSYASTYANYGVAIGAGTGNLLGGNEIQRGSVSAGQRGSVSIQSYLWNGEGTLTNRLDAGYEPDWSRIRLFDQTTTPYSETYWTVALGDIYGYVFNGSTLDTGELEIWDRGVWWRGYEDATGYYSEMEIGTNNLYIKSNWSGLSLDVPYIYNQSVSEGSPEVGAVNFLDSVVVGDGYTLGFHNGSGAKLEILHDGANEFLIWHPVGGVYLDMRDTEVRLGNTSEATHAYGTTIHLQVPDGSGIVEVTSDNASFIRFTSTGEGNFTFGPTVTNTNNIGSSSAPWSGGYIDNIYVDVLHSQSGTLLVDAPIEMNDNSYHLNMGAANINRVNVINFDGGSAIYDSNGQAGFAHSGDTWLPFGSGTGAGWVGTADSNLYMAGYNITDANAIYAYSFGSASTTSSGHELKWVEYSAGQTAVYFDNAYAIMSSPDNTTWLGVGGNSFGGINATRGQFQYLDGIGGSATIVLEADMLDATSTYDVGSNTLPFATLGGLSTYTNTITAISPVTVVTMGSNVKFNGTLEGDTSDITIVDDTILDAGYVSYYYGTSTYTNQPAFRLNPSTFELEYRDEDESGWTTLDSLSGGASAHSLGSATHSDVVITNPQNGEVLVYESSSGDWINSTVSGSGDNLGDHTATQDLDMDGNDIIDIGALYGFGASNIYINDTLEPLTTTVDLGVAGTPIQDAFVSNATIGTINSDNVDGVDISALNASYVAHSGDTTIHFLESTITHDNRSDYVSTEHLTPATLAGFGLADNATAIDVKYESPLSANGDTLGFDETAVNHDNLLGFVGTEHLDWTTNTGQTIDANNYVDNNSYISTATADLNMTNTYQVVNLQAPSAVGEAIRQTTNVTEANLNTLTGGGDTTLHDHDGITENTTHRTSTGADHTYIDQDVTSGSSPTFTGTNFSGIPDSALPSAITANSVAMTTGTFGTSMTMPDGDVYDNLDGDNLTYDATNDELDLSTTLTGITSAEIQTGDIDTIYSATNSVIAASDNVQFASSAYEIRWYINGTNDPALLVEDGTVKYRHDGDSTNHRVFRMDPKAQWFEPADTDDGIILWRSTRNATVLGVRCYATGGTSVEINVTNAGSQVTSGNLVCNADSWTTEDTLTNTSISSGTDLLVNTQTVTGVVSKIYVQVELGD